MREFFSSLLDRHAGDIEALGVEWVVFSGGEPLMHSDLFRLCERLRALGIRTTILTTGLLLGRYSRRIVEHMDGVIVSLDGPPEVHDRIRRISARFRTPGGRLASLAPAKARIPRGSSLHGPEAERRPF